MAIKHALFQLLLAAPLALAHPHGEVEPAHAAQPARRGLNHCAAKFAEQDLHRRMAKRHLSEISQLKEERGLSHLPTMINKRQMPGFGGGGFPGFGGGNIDREHLAEVQETDHASDMDVSLETDPASLFEDAGSCILSPEVTEGPLYVKGEDIRKELSDGEGGLKMRLAIQVVDVDTCEPVPESWIDLWSCNSTGVYGGVLYYPGNGDPDDLSVINVTTLRGVQPTDDDGIAIFDTLVPGHYAGRANHVHAMVHHDVTVQENGTITGGHVSHVGQLYFDQSLLEEIEQTEPYSTNTQSWMKNAVDGLFAAGTAGGDDPIVRYAMLGEDIENGIYAWMRFGVSVDAVRTYNPAAFMEEEGGRQNPSGPVQPGGFGGGMGGFPAMPGMPGMPGAPGDD